MDKYASDRLIRNWWTVTLFNYVYRHRHIISNKSMIQLDIGNTNKDVCVFFLIKRKKKKKKNIYWINPNKKYI